MKCVCSCRLRVQSAGTGDLTKTLTSVLLPKCSLGRSVLPMGLGHGKVLRSVQVRCLSHPLWGSFHLPFKIKLLPGQLLRQPAGGRCSLSAASWAPQPPRELRGQVGEGQEAHSGISVKTQVRHKGNWKLPVKLSSPSPCLAWESSPAGGCGRPALRSCPILWTVTSTTREG